MDLLTIANVLLVCLIALGCLCTCWFIYKQMEFHVWNVPPGPIGLPLVGYVKLIGSQRPYQVLAYLNRTYGKLCSLSVGWKRFIFVSDYDTAKELLGHPETLSRPENILDFTPGKGGFAGMNGKKWELERRLAMQAVRNIGLGKELWGHMIQEEIYVLMDSITAQKGEPMDLEKPLFRATLNSVSRLVLGERYVNEITKSDFESLCEAKELVKSCIRNAVFLIFPWMLKYLMKYNIGGFSKLNELMHEQDGKLRGTVLETLKSEDDETGNYIMQCAKQVRKQKRSEIVDDDSVETLIGNIAMFIITAETTSITMTWILCLMASFPKVQAQVHAEVDDVMGRKEISWQDRQRLPYTMACILEMERWATVLPIPTPRCAQQTFQFQGYSIPKGTFIILNLWAINHDPKYWDKPDKYIPERFLNLKTENLSSCRGYAPFSVGKRNCPADRIALMITFLFFASIMQKFKVATPTGETVDHLASKYNGTLGPKNQVLRFIERN